MFILMDILSTKCGFILQPTKKVPEYRLSDQHEHKSGSLDGQHKIILVPSPRKKRLPKGRKVSTKHPHTHTHSLH